MVKLTTFKEHLFRRHPEPSSWLLRRRRRRCWSKTQKNSKCGFWATTTVGRLPDAGKLCRTSVGGDGRPSLSRQPSRLFRLLFHFSFLLPHFPLSLPNTPSLATTPPPSVTLSLSTQFLHKSHHFTSFSSLFTLLLAQSSIISSFFILVHPI